MEDLLKSQAERKLEESFSSDEDMLAEAEAYLSERGLGDPVDAKPLPIDPPEQQAQAPAPAADGEQPGDAGEPGLLSRGADLAGKAADLAGDVASSVGDIATDPKKAGNVVGGAVIDTTEEIGNFAIDVANGFEGWMQERGYTEQDFVPDEFRLNYADKLIPQSDDKGTQVARKIAGYLIPYTGSLKALKAVKGLNTTARFFVAGAASGFVAIDPDEKRLADMVQETPWMRNPVAAMLASDPDDTRLDSRFKNAFESLIVDGVFTAGIEGLKLGGIYYQHMKGVRSARKMTAHGKKIDELAKNIEDEIRATEGFLPIGDQPLLGQIPDQKNLLKFTDEAIASGKVKPVEKRVSKTFQDLKENAAAKLETKEGVEEVLEKGGRGVVSDQQAVNLQALFKHAVEEFTEMVNQAIKSGNALDEVAIFNALDSLRIISSSGKKVASEAGAALNAQRAIYESTRKLKKAKYVATQLELLGGRERTRETIAAIKRVLDMHPNNLVEVMGEIVEKSATRRLNDVLHEVWINGLLSSGKTISNVIINGMGRHVVEIGDTVIAATISKLKKLPASDRVYFGEIPIQVSAATQELWDQMFVNISSILDGTKMYSSLVKNSPKFNKSLAAAQGRRKNLPDLLTVTEANDLVRNINSKQFGYEGWQAAGIDFVGNVINLPVAAMRGSDKVIGAMHFRREARRLAYRQGRQKGLAGAELDKFMDDMLVTTPKELSPQFANLQRSIKRNAIQEADRARFIEGLTGRPEQIAEVLKHPILRWWYPFVKTGMNTLLQGLERIPGLHKVTASYARSFESEAAHAMAQARYVGGGLFMGAIGGLAYGGHITGGGPRNKEQRRIWAMDGTPDGKQPYSVKLGGTWVSFERIMDPYARGLKLVADLSEVAGFAYDTSSNDPDGNFFANKDLVSLMQATAGYIGTAASPEFITGSTGDLIALLDGSERGDHLNRNIKKFTTGLIPFSGLLRSIRQEVDPIKRETKTFDDSLIGILERQLNEIKNTIPGFSESLNAQKNMYAETVHYPGGMGFDLISPIITHKSGKDPVAEELIRLGVVGIVSNPTPKKGESHLKIRMPQPFIPTRVGKQSHSIPMTSEQHDQYIDWSAGEGLVSDEQFVEGMTLKEALTHEVTNDYPMLEFEDNKTDEHKRTIIRLIVDGYRSFAMGKLISEDDDILREMEQNAENVQEAFGGEE